MLSSFRSLRWRIQSWHAMILIAVVVGFGTVLHWETVRGHWDRVDEELLSAARVLEGSLRGEQRPILESLAQDMLHGPGPNPRGPGHPPPPPPRRPTRPGESSPPPADSHVPPAIRLRWETPDSQPNDPPIEPWESSVSLPSGLPGQLDRGEGPAYYIIYRKDGSILRQVDVPDDYDFNRPLVQVLPTRDRYSRQVRGILREVLIRGPHQTTICVGRPVANEEHRLSRLTLIMLLTGASVIGVGLLGGWWLSGRAIAPIEKITQTAGNINANNLSERIAIEGFDTELNELGTVLNTMLDRLDASFEQQRRFTADASHELRTPLAVILSSSELALSKPRSAEHYREHLMQCERAANRMRELIESLLTLARLDASSNAEPHVRVDLANVIADAIELLIPLAEEFRVKLESKLHKCEVSGVASRLSQAIVNLISNAIKYNRPDGRVTVRLTAEPGTAVIEVIDTGIGIPAEDVPHVFDRFYRVTQSRSRTDGGTGLGLSICERIVHGHGGTIAVESILGAGSTFRIRLPALPPSSNLPAHESGATEHQHA